MLPSPTIAQYLQRKRLAAGAEPGSDQEKLARLYEILRARAPAPEPAPLPRPTPPREGWGFLDFLPGGRSNVPPTQAIEPAPSPAPPVPNIAERLAGRTPMLNVAAEAPRPPPVANPLDLKELASAEQAKRPEILPGIGRAHV